MKPPNLNNYVHAQDVLGFIIDCEQQKIAVALIVVTHIQGGAVRAPGALLAVREDGEMAGYISNGCVDADLIAQSIDAVSVGAPRRISYGAGSDYKDILLPCGGRIELLIVPRPDMGVIDRAYTYLMDRQVISLTLSAAGTLSTARVLPAAGEEACYKPDHKTDLNHVLYSFTYRPKLRLRIAGRGAEVLALMRAAHALDYDMIIQSPDQRIGAGGEHAEAFGAQFQHLKSVNDPPMTHDDPDTAFILLFHDHDWESALLRQALSGPAFYIGAMGGRETRRQRIEVLTSENVDARDIERICSPIGLVPSARNSSHMAISILAEIINIYKQVYNI